MKWKALLDNNLIYTRRGKLLFNESFIHASFLKFQRSCAASFLLQMREVEIIHIRQSAYHPRTNITYSR